MSRPPKSENSSSQRELDRAEKQFEAFDKNIKELTLHNMNLAPKEEKEEQTKLSTKEIEKSKDIYLKPVRSFGPGVNPKTGEKEKFNERFREDYNFAKEYVHFIAENIEIIGETIKLALKKFPGTNIDHWEVPVNVPVWGPRMLAERLTECGYHVLKMEDRSTGSDAQGNSYYGQLVAKSKVQRLDARPVTSKKSVFMGAQGF